MLFFNFSLASALLNLESNPNDICGSNPPQSQEICNSPCSPNIANPINIIPTSEICANNKMMDCAELCALNGYDTPRVPGYYSGDLLYNDYINNGYPGGDILNPGTGINRSYYPPGGYNPPYYPVRPTYTPDIPDIPLIPLIPFQPPVSRTYSPPPAITSTVTAVLTNIVTNVIQKPPVTVIPPPETVIFTKHGKPVTTTLPPLVFQIPTTIVKTAPPETIIETMPPQVIYPPPITSTIHHQIQYPPTTVVINRTIPPLTRMVPVPGPVRTVSLPPKILVSVSTVTLPPRTIAVGFVSTVSPPSAPSFDNQPKLYGNNTGNNYGINKSNTNMGYPGGYNEMNKRINANNGYGTNTSDGTPCNCPDSGSVGNGGCTCVENYPMPPMMPPVGNQSPGNTCVQDITSCFSSMLGSKYPTNPGSNQCITNNVSPCISDNNSSSQDYPRTMEPNNNNNSTGEELSSNSPTNYRDQKPTKQSALAEESDS